MSQNIRQKITGNELRIFLYASAAILLLSAFLLATPAEIYAGMKSIVFSRDVLLTDYFKIAGYGASFFNAALLLIFAISVLEYEKIPFTGITMATLSIVTCYGFWGKNFFTAFPILLGNFIFAKLHRSLWSRYIYIGLFGICLGPIVKELVFILPFSTGLNLLCAFFIGMVIGFVLPPLSAHTTSMHLGYNLFNVGFSAGILAFAINCFIRSFGLNVEGDSVWLEGMHPGITVGMYLFFILTFLYGCWLSNWDLRALWNITRHPGRAVADFVLMDGPGATLMNMSVVGLIGQTYILLIDGDFSGPVQGAIIMAFGFAAFGAHIKNYLPVLLGVVLSTVFSQYSPNTYGIQIAALFAVGLSPIAGQFGIFSGILAGILHSTIVMCTSPIYGGLNLYNNGFSAGWVAIILVPLIESFITHFEMRKKEKHLK
jgi:hypothetical protein